MRILSLLVTLFCAIVGCCSSVDADQRQLQKPQPLSVPLAPARVVQGSAVSSMVLTYCAGCHNGVTRSPSGGLLDQFDASRIADNPDVWARAYRQLQAGTMPPVGAARPDRKAYDATLRGIEDALDAGSPPPSPASNQQTAERLASVLWNSAPDAALLDDAQKNRLANQPGVERQVRRMLADDRARAFVSRFFFPWLGLDRLGQADPDKAHFPDWEASLKEAMATETELFVLSQLRENRDPLELWNANYTFVNEPLARHYGISGVTGAQFKRVSTKPERAGLLGQGSVLMVTSRHQHGKDAAYTSPAARAIWVRMHFLGAPPPNPAPNAQPVKPELPITPQTRVLPAEPCVNCHRNFFPLGYALEHFDPIGRWRTHDQAGPVDASGALVDGTSIDGVVQLRKGLLLRPDAFRTVITETLLVHASGQPMTAASSTPQTLMQARRLLRSKTATRWSSLIAEVVRAGGPGL
jgi:hypothetical protein